MRTREREEKPARWATVLPELDHHVSLAWEDVCREHVLHPDATVSTVGRWWGQVPTGDGRRTEEREIDVVGVDGEGKPIVFGMCKWTSSPVDFDELNLLERLMPYAGGDGESVRRYLFSRSGFSTRLAEFAASREDVILVTPTDFYRD